MATHFFILAFKNICHYLSRFYFYMLTALLISFIFYSSLYQLILNKILVNLIALLVTGPLFLALFDNYLKYLSNQKESYLLSIYNIYKKAPYLYLTFSIYYLLVNLILYKVRGIPYPYVESFINIVQGFLLIYSIIFYLITNLILIDSKNIITIQTVKLIKEVYSFINQHSFFILQIFIGLIGWLLFYVIILEFIWVPILFTASYMKKPVSFGNYYRNIMLVTILVSIPFLFSLITNIYRLKKNPLIDKFKSPWLNNN